MHGWRRIRVLTDDLRLELPPAGGDGPRLGVHQLRCTPQWLIGAARWTSPWTPASRNVPPQERPKVALVASRPRTSSNVSGGLALSMWITA